MTSSSRAAWIDVSVPIAPGLVPLWPGAPEVRFDRRLDVARGDAATDTTLSMSVHTGTHIDAPAHTLEGGATSDAIPLSWLIGPACIVDLEGVDLVTAELLERLDLPRDTTRLLIRTDNSARWSDTFASDFVALSPDASAWIVERGMRLVGVDYLSVQPFDGPRAVHDILLQAGVVIVEGLDLSAAPTGACELMCLPLALHGCEGAPARVIVRPC